MGVLWGERESERSPVALGPCPRATDRVTRSSSPCEREVAVREVFRPAALRGLGVAQELPVNLQRREALPAR